MRAGRVTTCLALLAVAVTSCSAVGDGRPARRGASGIPMAGSGDLNVRAENAKAGTTAWRIPAAQAGTVDDVAGYTDKPTIMSGETFQLFVSTSKTSLRAAAYRVGYYGGKGAREYWHSGALRARRQTAQSYLVSTRTVIEKWQSTATVSSTGWPAGVYLIKLTAGTGSSTRCRYVTLVVRSGSTAGRVVLMPSLFTSNAYNMFGGRSAYTGPGGFSSRAFAVSFHRPNSWKTYGLGTGKFLSYERPVVFLAESLGLPLAYESDLDISTVSGVLTGARAVVTLGHAEYWSVPERNAIEAARNRGTNVIFLGANTSYWRVRLTSSNSVMVIYKSTADPVYPAASTTTKWQLAPHARPERRLTGLTYNCFPASGSFTVVEPGFWAFAGTGAARGSQYKGILGPEVDEVVNSSDVPRPIEVVASSAASCGGRSSMTYYTTSSGSGVVSTGTMGWVLRGFASGAPSTTRAFVVRVTTNLLREASLGPLAKRHPATDNLRSFG